MDFLEPQDEHFGYAGFADFLDGKKPLVRRAEILFDEEIGALRIIAPQQRERRWPFQAIREIPDQAGRDMLVLGCLDEPLARLMVDETDAIRHILRRCPDLHRRPPAQGQGRLIGWAAAALASVALIIFGLVPILANQLAGFIPPEGERALGDATYEQIRDALSESGFQPLPVCSGAKGRDALEQMQARLTEGVDLPYPLTVTVLDHPMVNAFALPGGRVVFFRGLIEEAGAAEEVAAVLAHEIGHVAARDPTRIALRSAGSVGVLGLVLGDFAGGAVVLFLAERLIEASYSQEAEAAADAFAAERLAAAGVPPDALARFFRRLQKKHGDADGIVAHFLSHPRLAERIASAEGTAAPGETRPILGKAEWAALRQICD